MKKILTCTFILTLIMLFCCACGSAPAESAESAAEAPAAPESVAAEPATAEETAPAEEPVPTEEPAPLEAAGMTREELLEILPDKWESAVSLLTKAPEDTVNWILEFNADGTGIETVYPGTSYERTINFKWELNDDLSLVINKNQFYKVTKILDRVALSLMSNPYVEYEEYEVTLMRRADAEDILSTVATKVTVSKNDIGDYVAGPVELGVQPDAFGNEQYFYGVYSPAYESGLVFLGAETTTGRLSAFGNVEYLSGLYSVIFSNEDNNGKNASYSFAENSSGWIQYMDEATLYYIDSSYVDDVYFVTRDFENGIAVVDGVEVPITTYYVSRCIRFTDGSAIWYDYMQYCGAPAGSETVYEAPDFSNIRY